MLLLKPQLCHNLALHRYFSRNIILQLKSLRWDWKCYLSMLLVLFVLANTQVFYVKTCALKIVSKVKYMKQYK